MIKYVVDFDGLMQSDFEKKNQRPNSVCVRVCLHLYFAALWICKCVACSRFCRGKYKDSGCR